jgi:hypothetical protein
MWSTFCLPVCLPACLPACLPVPYQLLNRFTDLHLICSDCMLQAIYRSNEFNFKLQIIALVACYAPLIGSYLATFRNNL